MPLFAETVNQMLKICLVKFIGFFRQLVLTFVFHTELKNKERSTWKILQSIHGIELSIQFQNHNLEVMVKNIKYQRKEMINSTSISFTFAVNKLHRSLIPVTRKQLQQKNQELKLRKNNKKMLLKLQKEMANDQTCNFLKIITYEITSLYIIFVI